MDKKLSKKNKNIITNKKSTVVSKKNIPNKNCIKMVDYFAF